jgi:hypothetical protein
MPVDDRNQAKKHALKLFVFPLLGKVCERLSFKAVGFYLVRGQHKTVYAIITSRLYLLRY